MEMRTLTALAVVICMVYQAHCYSSYMDDIPNAGRVQNPCQSSSLWPGVGHKLSAGDGGLNPFGRDFKNGPSVGGGANTAGGEDGDDSGEDSEDESDSDTENDSDSEDADDSEKSDDREKRQTKKAWTMALCRADSDGDGMTNGEELGDPDCTWTPGATPQRTTGITHPGICNPVGDPKCAAVNSWLPANCPPEEPLVNNGPVIAESKTGEKADTVNNDAGTGNNAADTVNIAADTVNNAECSMKTFLADNEATITALVQHCDAECNTDTCKQEITKFKSHPCLKEENGKYVIDQLRKIVQNPTVKKFVAISDACFQLPPQSQPQSQPLVGSGGTIVTRCMFASILSGIIVMIGLS